MLGSLTQPHLWTANLLVIGLVQGLIVSLIAMGIVLVYRSSRVINFAVGSIGIPAVALFAVMAGVHGWPYIPSLILALILGTLSGVAVTRVILWICIGGPAFAWGTSLCEG